MKQIVTYGLMCLTLLNAHSAFAESQFLANIEGVKIEFETYSPPIVITGGFVESGRRLPDWFESYLISVVPQRFTYDQFLNVMEFPVVNVELFEDYKYKNDLIFNSAETLHLEYSMKFSEGSSEYVLVVTKIPRTKAGSSGFSKIGFHFIRTAKGWKWFYPDHGVIWTSSAFHSQEELIKLIHDKGLPRIPVNVIPDIVVMNLPVAMVGDAVDIEELLPKPKSTPETSTAANVSAPQSLGTKPELPSPETASTEESPAAWWPYLAVALAATGLLFFWLRRKTNR